MYVSRKCLLAQVVLKSYKSPAAEAAPALDNLITIRAVLTRPFTIITIAIMPK